MAPILTIFGPNESQRCQLNFEKILGRRKNFREGEKYEKVREKFENLNYFGPYRVFGTKQNRNVQMIHKLKKIQQAKQKLS